MGTLDYERREDEQPSAADRARLLADVGRLLGEALAADWLQARRESMAESTVEARRGLVSGIGQPTRASEQGSGKPTRERPEPGARRAVARRGAPGEGSDGGPRAIA